MLDKFFLPSVITLFLIKIIAFNLTAFNLFGDEAQYWLWSKDVDFGYFSKPPFLAWVIRFYTEIFGSSFVILKILPSLIYFLTASGIYNIFKNLGVSSKDSMAGSLLFLFIPAVSFSSFIISTDLLLLLFWTLSLNELIKIIQEQRKRNFIFMGVFLGLAFLSKYAAVYFFICLLCLFLLDKNFRSIFLNNFLSFGLCFLCVLLIIAPNIIWNIKNDWITFNHTSDNANLENIEFDLVRGLEFLFIQGLMLGPFLVFGGAFSLLKINKLQKILLVFSLPIIIIVFIEAVIVRANANWAAPALVSLFILFYMGIKNYALKIFNFVFNLTFCFIFFVMIAISYPLNVFDRINGLQNYAEKIYNLSSNQFLKNIVISDRLLFSSISYELREKNIKFFMPHEKNADITNHFKMSSALKSNMKKNFIFIGSPSDINYLENKYKLIKKISPDQKFTKRKLGVYEVIFK